MEPVSNKKVIVGPCARCGRQVTKPKVIGSLILGRDCYYKMIAEGFEEHVDDCPLCHQRLVGDHVIRVTDDTIELLAINKFKTLDEFRRDGDAPLPADNSRVEQSG